MLSYQHAYHAGNLADVHKHALLAWTLDYLTRKDKPLSYIETHAGRAIYDLGGAAARKTGEAARGIERARALFDKDHPYAHALAGVRAAHGPRAYPGSPLVAASLLRPGDRMDLAELHPREHAALQAAMAGRGATCHRRDGIALAHALLPPMPRRGLLLVDPSYEIKTDYDTLPRQVAKWHRAWNVGIVMLWFPVLASGAHRAMQATLAKTYPDALLHEIAFPPARPGHGMVGSGLFVLNPPYGLAEEAARLEALLHRL